MFKNCREIERLKIGNCIGRSSTRQQHQQTTARLQTKSQQQQQCRRRGLKLKPKIKLLKHAWHNYSHYFFWPILHSTLTESYEIALIPRC